MVNLSVEFKLKNLSIQENETFYSFHKPSCHLISSRAYLKPKTPWKVLALVLGQVKVFPKDFLKLT